VLRDGLVQLLTDRGFEITAAVSDAVALTTSIASDRPDVAVIDIRMPPTFTDEGLRAALELRREHPGLAILLFSQYVETRYAADLLADNAAGIGYQLLGASRRTDSISTLSGREREVLSLMAEGRSNAAIALALVVSEGAVEKHVANIFAKLDLPVSQSDHRRVLAVLRFLDS
jgi:DNA-binding NarL/FixJ family response regulator